MSEVDKAALMVLRSWLARASKSHDPIPFLMQLMEEERERAVDEIISEIAQNKDGKSVFATA